MNEPTGEHLIRIEHAPTTSLGEATASLRGVYGESEKASIKSFEINPRSNPISAEELRQLTAFPFEFSVHEVNGNVRVTTGEEHHPSDPDKIGVPKDTSLYSHSHRKTSNNVFISFFDVFITARVGSRAQQVLITREGLVVYKRPQFDPIRNTPTDESPRELMSDWGNQHGIDFFGINPQEDAKRFIDLPDEEKMQIAKDYARDTHMVVMETRWEDTEGVVKVLDAINMRAVITDNKAPKLPSVLDNFNVDLDSLDEDGPQRATIKTIAQHIDYVKYKKGGLFRDRNMRQNWKEFAGKLADQCLEENPSESIKELLLRLKESAQRLSID